MNIVRAGEHRAMPWKNGGGITHQIAICPSAAQGFDDFDWRVSMARVEASGPFSVFAGVDRSLAIMAGEGLRLTVAGANTDIGPASPPVVFAADLPVAATLTDGPVLDINVMTRRPAWRHLLGRETLDGRRVFRARGTAMLLVVRTGFMTVETSQAPLGARDAVMLAANEQVTAAPVDGVVDLFRIDLWQLP